MSAAAVISQLRGLLEKANRLIPKLIKIYPNEEQWEILGDISEKLSATAARMENKIQESKESRTERAWKESEKLRSHALECKDDLLTNGRLKQSPVFRRNIVTIFDSPKNSKFDSAEIKLRKNSDTTKMRADPAPESQWCDFMGNCVRAKPLGRRVYGNRHIYLSSRRD